jgi:NAD(P)H-hydrate repair Nnr-like enzyme with NAD(P)H-hydrate dehydratase domain
MSNTPNTQLEKYLSHVKFPEPDSHKGQNGKVMIIGGSELFHAASKWSLDMASKFVDMVFYSSVPSNNELVQEAKGNFWNGIVIRREDLESYLQEANVILIGPGMTREKYVDDSWTEKLLAATTENISDLATTFDWNKDTYAVSNYLVKKYADKKWVIDAGALQMLEPSLLRPNMIITPHQKEVETLINNYNTWATSHNQSSLPMQFSASSLEQLNNPVVLLKGKVDQVFTTTETVEIEGGNAGMTKGGTGDALAGLTAALYCFNDAMTSAVAASYINKKAGDSLYEQVGPNFNTSDLISEVPKVLWKELQKFSGRL